jgi:hypothetical protein
MTYMKDGSPFLFDDTTGDIIGIKDPDGSEHALCTKEVFGLVANSTADGAAQRNYSLIQSGLNQCVAEGGRSEFTRWITNLYNPSFWV